MQTAQVIPFRFEAREVRTLLIDDQPWFVAADVSAALKYRIAGDMTRNLDDDEKGTQIVRTPGGDQEMLVINESGLYSAILRSRKAEAKRFKKWVTAEVLPAIRKHGRYEDADGRMATLVGQTIGTDGFHMLGSLIKGKVSSLPVPVQRRATAKIWSQTHAAFGVRSAADIPAEQLDAARNFIAAYNVLEGEYIEGRKVGGLYLNDYETHHLYLLMSRFAIMSEHRGSMLAAARALDSKPLWTIFGQLDEGRSSFAKLDQRRTELYAIYSKDGFRGGYAMQA
jgi:prophage antirepressor-like protein